MWGLRGHARGFQPSSPMFPTHVGIALARSRQDHGILHVPYACGDCADARGARAVHARCSLRMWGLRILRQLRRAASVMFPTHVGIARSCHQQGIATGDVPYACGDCATLPPAGHRHQGCSLRMWGLRGTRFRHGGAWSMFPTHVGIARPKRRACWTSSNVPYACGDCAPDRIFDLEQIACSLRMWGLRG